MTTENRLLFSGQTSTSEAIISDGFNDISFLYLKTTADFEVEVDSFLQIYIDTDIQRMIKINSPSILNTEQVFLIPQDYRLSEYNQRMAMYFSDVIDIELWGVKTDCCLQKQVEKIERTTDAIYRHIAVRDAIDVVQFAGNALFNGLMNYLGGQIVGAIATQILAPSLRKGFYILNPPRDTLLNPVGGNLNVDFLQGVDVVNQLSIPPANVYVDDTNFLGSVVASSDNGSINTLVREFF